jgi:hypothetical protein
MSDTQLLWEGTGAGKFTPRALELFWRAACTTRAVIMARRFPSGAFEATSDGPTLKSEMADWRVVKRIPLKKIDIESLVGSNVPCVFSDDDDRENITKISFLTEIGEDENGYGDMAVFYRDADLTVWDNCMPMWDRWCALEEPGKNVLPPGYRYEARFGTEKIGCGYPMIAVKIVGLHDGWEE